MLLTTSIDTKYPQIYISFEIHRPFIFSPDSLLDKVNRLASKNIVKQRFSAVYVKIYDFL